MILRMVLSACGLTLVILLVVPLIALVLGTSPGDLLQAAQDGEVLQAIAVSLTCAAVAVGIGMVLGVPAGYLLARRRVPLGGLWEALIDLPLVVPHPVVGIALLLVFGRHRLVGAALRDHFGLEVVSSAPGIIIAMLVVSSPFIVKSARDAFRSVPLATERAAYSLGASETRTFFTVSLPLALPGIGSGVLVAWARAISEFGSVVVVAYYPRTAPVLIWDRFSAHGLRAAIPPSLLLLLVCLAIFLLFKFLDRRRRTVAELER